MFTLWYRWLLVVYTVFVLFGLAFAVGSGTGLFAPLVDQINTHFWGSAALSPEAAKFQLFAYGIAGSLTAAFGEICWFVTRYAIAKREMWAWNALAASIVLWYVIDSGISAYTGAMINVLSNTLLAALVVIPLIGIRRHLSPARTAAAPA